MSTQAQIRVIPYREAFIEMFKSINYEWLEKYFEVTELDDQTFDNPKKEIIDKGGYIYLAEYQDEIVGSVALERMTDKVYALTRMGVKTGFQGQNIGQELMRVAIKKSKELNLNSVVLYTNHILINALNLYFKNGFKAVPLDDVLYRRATIKMELKVSL